MKASSYGVFLRKQSDSRTYYYVMDLRRFFKKSLEAITAPAKTGYMILDISSKLAFGKYRDMTVRYVIERDPKYLIWASQNIYGFDLSRTAEVKLFEKLNKIFIREEKQRRKQEAFRRKKKFDRGQRREPTHQPRT